ncbi:hypothetical protein ABH900_001710 [Stenotrophomonas sp. AN71]
MLGLWNGPPHGQRSWLRIYPRMAWIYWSDALALYGHTPARMQ